MHSHALLFFSMCLTVPLRTLSIKITCWKKIIFTCSQHPKTFLVALSFPSDEISSAVQPWHLPALFNYHFEGRSILCMPCNKVALSFLALAASWSASDLYSLKSPIRLSLLQYCVFPYRFSLPCALPSDDQGRYCLYFSSSALKVT